jgi:hypothetical protein
MAFAFVIPNQVSTLIPSSTEALAAIKLKAQEYAGNLSSTLADVRPRDHQRRQDC